MRRVNIRIPIYDWDLTLITIYNAEDAEPYRKYLQEIEASEEAIETSVGYVLRHCVNGGDTWRDVGQRTATIVIYPWTDEEHFIETLNHEKRHLVDRIMEWARINDTEAAAYLDGYVSKEVFKHIKELTQ